MLQQILCIDDDPITLMLSKKVISKSEFSTEIITAQNGEEALHYFNTLKYNKNKVIIVRKITYLEVFCLNFGRVVNPIFSI